MMVFGVCPEVGIARFNTATFTEGIKKNRQKLNFGRPAQHVARNDGERSQGGMVQTTGNGKPDVAKKCEMHKKNRENA